MKMKYFDIFHNRLQNLKDIFANFYKKIKKGFYFFDYFNYFYTKYKTQQTQNKTNTKQVNTNPPKNQPLPPFEFEYLNGDGYLPRKATGLVVHYLL